MSSLNNSKITSHQRTITGPRAVSCFITFQWRTRWNTVKGLLECGDIATLCPLFDGIPGFPAGHLGGKANSYQLFDLDMLAGGYAHGFTTLTPE